MEEYIAPDYDSSPCMSPERQRSPSPLHSPVKERRGEKLTDEEFLRLKNREKRAYNKRIGGLNLLREKHLVTLMQELLEEVCHHSPFF